MNNATNETDARRYFRQARLVALADYAEAVDAIMARRAGPLVCGTQFGCAHDALDMFYGASTRERMVIGGALAGF